MGASDEVRAGAEALEDVQSVHSCYYITTSPSTRPPTHSYSEDTRPRTQPVLCQWEIFTEKLLIDVNNR